MEAEKRKVRTYKATDKDYNNARKVVKKTGTTLSQLIEVFVAITGSKLKSKKNA